MKSTFKTKHSWCPLPSDYLPNQTLIHATREPRLTHLLTTNIHGMKPHFETYQERKRALADWKWSSEAKGKQGNESNKAVLLYLPLSLSRLSSPKPLLCQGCEETKHLFCIESWLLWSSSLPPMLRIRVSFTFCSSSSFLFILFLVCSSRWEVEIFFHPMFCWVLRCCYVHPSTWLWRMMELVDLGELLLNRNELS